MEFVHLLWKPIEGNQNFIFVTLVLIVLDVVVGFTNALAHGQVSSSKMRTGLWHKLGSIFLLLSADVIDGALLGGVDLGFQSPVLVGVCLYVSVMELVSVIENVCKLNPELAENPLIGAIAGRMKTVSEGSEEQA